MNNKGYIHIGLQVLEKDVKSFYEDILHFVALKTFELSDKEAMDIFKIPQSAKLATETNSTLLGQIPLVAEVGEAAEKGLSIYNQYDQTVISAFENILKKLV